MKLFKLICTSVVVLYPYSLLPTAVLGQSSTDLFDVTQTTINVSSHTPAIGSSNNNLAGSDAIYNMFGASNPHVEPNNRVLFNDGTGTAFVNFTRSGASAVNTITLYEESDGGVEDNQRGVQNFSFFGDRDGDGLFEAVFLPSADPIDNASANTYVIPTSNFTRFRAEFTPPSGPGSRIEELDATFDPLQTNSTYRDRYLLNATTNGAGDDPAGLVNSITASSSLGNIDDPEDAFGNNNGDIEGDTFLFGGDGVQTIDFTTSSSVTLVGIAPNTGADNGEDGFRGTSLFRFFADLGAPGFGDDAPLVTVNPSDDNIFDLLLFVSPVTASSFRAEFTSSGGESRVLEIDAIVVPEPNSIALLGIAATLLAVGRRRSRI